jgi:hypothetical protein
MMSRFQRLLRTIKHMVEPYRPPKRPTFLTDYELEARIKVARDLMGDVEPKPDRKLIEEQPDYGETEFHGPIG